jgi:hypothetical protein
MFNSNIMNDQEFLELIISLGEQNKLSQVPEGVEDTISSTMRT